MSTDPVTTMKPYRISRAPAPAFDQPHDPFAKLIFEPSLESDELFDALRVSYPALKTHTERKKQAVLDFFMEERRAIDFDMSAFVQQTNAPTPAPVDTPEGTKVSTPYSQYSYVDQRTSSSSSASASSQSAGSSPEVPALKEMTSVWSAAPNAQPKIHTRRTMTSQEKEEYRQRRKMKACKECRVRKRKCTHNLLSGVSPPDGSRVKHKSGKRNRNSARTPVVQSIDEFNVNDNVFTGSETMNTPFDFSECSPINGLFGDFPLFPNNDLLSLQDTMELSAEPGFWAAPENDFMSQYIDPLGHGQLAHIGYSPASQPSSASSRSARAECTLPAGTISPSQTLMSHSQTLIMSAQPMASSQANFNSDWDLHVKSGNSALGLPAESRSHQVSEIGPCREERSWNNSSAYRLSPQEPLQAIAMPSSRQALASAPHTSGPYQLQTGSDNVLLDNTPTHTLNAHTLASVDQGSGHLSKYDSDPTAQIGSSGPGVTRHRLRNNGSLRGVASAATANQVLTEPGAGSNSRRSAQPVFTGDIALLPAEPRGTTVTQGAQSSAAASKDARNSARSTGSGAHDRRGLVGEPNSDGNSTYLAAERSSAFSSHTSGCTGISVLPGLTGSTNAPLAASRKNSGRANPHGNVTISLSGTSNDSLGRRSDSHEPGMITAGHAMVSLFSGALAALAGLVAMVLAAVFGLRASRCVTSISLSSFCMSTHATSYANQC
ncbi:hypothetical protein K490DRAFT_61325 [Saccharata proteae CBS 121410]|uniref:Uncharacterized protein n=1 Tax=Saccharata proteae CBS 121410 TaxID=1314787 RepID=A0A9P4LZX7_9PEZI|nr:hypothetical protein K490DRAFT_61325 [Saccharata proteae CBS 121410]